MSVKYQNQFYLIIIVVFALTFSQIFIIIPNSSQALVKETNKEITNNNSAIINDRVMGTTDLVALDTLNAISFAKVTCSLHLKTTQVQLDIDFVGVSTLKDSTISPNVNTLERISVLGEIRNVQVVESDVNILVHTLAPTENGTMIQFELSSIIPVGVNRNIKITYIQDTEELVETFRYQFGIYWMRRVGSHSISILCDNDISILNCFPSPHTISTSGEKLVLAWLEVNPFQFYTNISYARKVIIDELIIIPNEWDVGQLKTNPTPLEKTFEIINNENTQLAGTIITPEWITVNISDWSLSVGEKMFIKVTLDISKVRDLPCNISLQCSFASFPVNIQLTGIIREKISLTSIILIILSCLVIISTIPIVYVFLARRKDKSMLNKHDSINYETEDLSPIEKIDLEKWKELLTDKEFIIFECIVKNIELTQSDIVEKTSLSKSTVSRAVGRLVVKGLIKKKPYGMSNIITLNEF